jgi:hypothetical protein
MYSVTNKTGPFDGGFVGPSGQRNGATTVNNLSCQVLQDNLHKLSSRDQEFARSLIGNSVTQKNGLSDKQQACVNNLIERAKGTKEAQRGGKPERETVTLANAESFASLIAMFDKATEYKGKVSVKNPKITIRDGNEVLVIERCGNASSYTGQLNVKTPGSFQDCTWFGRIDRNGVFTKSPRAAMSASLLALLQAFTADPAKVAAQHGKDWKTCCFCNIKITTDESKAVGYGPDCAARYGLPWG